MPWIFYSWAVSLTHSGASLISECLIDALKQFDSVQLASIGVTAMPLVASVVSRGAGRYSGLCVRPERENWGTRRQVEGIGDKSKPVVVVDDCICSGNSFRRAAHALEKDGYRVEGAVCLVDFPWKGGTEWARALGYKVETLFDVWADLEMCKRQNVGPHNDRALPFDAQSRVPDGLTPADAARWVASHFLNCGKIPRPPEKLAGDFEGPGGVMVSFRDRRSEYRVARNGFYRVSSQDADLCRDLVLATAKTLLSSKTAIAEYGLERLKVAVTLFGEQTPILPNELDFSQFGILIQSTAQPQRLGGALPNTQFFVSEIEQLRHARFTNAHLWPFEPFAIFRHTVEKSVESGCTWPSFGTSMNNNDALEDVGDLLIARAREVLNAARTGATIPNHHKLPPNLLSELADGIVISLYHHGLIGCWMSWTSDLDAMICEATIGTLNDDRYVRDIDPGSADIDIVVSVLHVGESLESVSSGYAGFKLRLGKDSLAVWHNGKSAFLLAHTPCHRDWTKKEMADHACGEASIIEGSPNWATYRTRSWLGRSGRAIKLESGYPRRPEARLDGDHRQTIHLLARYIVEKIRSARLPEYCYWPISDRTIATESATRPILALESLLHAACFLNDQSLRETALRGLRYCCRHIKSQHGVPKLDLPGVTCGFGAEVFLVNAVYRSGDGSLIDMPELRQLGRRMQSFFHADGAISWQREGFRVDSEHDFFPGFMLRMAATIAEVKGVDALPRSLEKHLAWYRRRFSLLHPWGMVWWQIQGWAPIHALIGGAALSSFVYELADWALMHQLDKNGAFLVDYYQTGPSFHTACVLEGIAEAWALARRAGNDARATRYKDAWERGVKFLDRLIIRDEDTFAMPKPGRSLGGVRESLTSSKVRIDYVAHALLALLKGSVQIAGQRAE